MKIISLFNPTVAKVFIKTLVYQIIFNGKSPQEKLNLKQAWAKMVVSSFGFKIQIIGSPPIEKSFILVGNHISFLDIPVLMASLPEVTFIAKDDLKKWPIIGSGAAAVGTIFVSRTSGSDRSLVRDQVSKVLQEHKSMVAIFPSGTTCLYEDRPWKRGAFEIAKQAQVPIQLFKLSYLPLRESAYIDDDNLLDQMAKLVEIKDKQVTVTWMEQFDSIGDSEILANQLRLKLIHE